MSSDRVGVISVWLGCALLLLLGFSGGRFASGFTSSDNLLIVDWTRHVLHDGLADYWIARPATVSSNWNLQVDPINSECRAVHWGNDPASYRTSTFDHAQPPKYNFIILAGLDPASIRAHFGNPERELSCDSGKIWIFDKSIDVSRP